MNQLHNSILPDWIAANVKLFEGLPLLLIEEARVTAEIEWLHAALPEQFGLWTDPTIFVLHKNLLVMKQLSLILDIEIHTQKP